MLILKNWRHETVFAAFGVDSPLSAHCFDSSFVSGVKCSHVSSLVMNRCKTLPLLLWNTTKHSIETSSGHCFCSIASKHNTHFVHSFLISKFSVNMRCIAPFEMPTMSASLYTFSRWSSKTILWIFFIISGMITSFGWPLQCLLAACMTLFKLCHPIFYCFKRRSTNSLRVESSLTLILLGLRPSKWK